MLEPLCLIIPIRCAGMRIWAWSKMPTSNNLTVTLGAFQITELIDGLRQYLKSWPRPK